MAWVRTVMSAFMGHFDNYQDDWPVGTTGPTQIPTKKKGTGSFAYS